MGEVANNGIREELYDYLRHAYGIRGTHTYSEKISYWIDVFQQLLPDGPEEFFISKYPDKMTLWLFSHKYILMVSDFLHDSQVEKDDITVYPLSQIIGGISLNIRDYSLHDPRYDDVSTITLRFKVNQETEPVEIAGTRYDCPRLVRVAKFLLGNL